MKKWFAKISCGAGMTCYETIEAPNKDKAERLAREECIDWASSFGYYQDLDYFGDNDQLYREDSEEENEDGGIEYTVTSELVYYVEEYIPEEHDDYLY